jgi:homoserine O-acetyltransferase
VLQWAVDHPERVMTSIVIAAAPRLSSQGIAFDVVGRNAIRHDPRFAGGQYYDGPAPESGLALARMLAHITYLSDESMRSKFDPTRLQPRAVETGFESTFSVGSYLAYQGTRFVERFDANSYITLSTAMDLFDLGDSDEAIRASLAPSSCRWFFISFSSDWLFPASASRRMVDALVAQSKPVRARPGTTRSCSRTAWSRARA